MTAACSQCGRPTVVSRDAASTREHTFAEAALRRCAVAVYLSNDDVRQVLTMSACIEALDSALQELAEGRAANEPRSHGYLAGPRDGTVFRMKLFHGGVTALGMYALRVLTDFLEPRTVAGMERETQAVSYTHLRAHETVLDLVC